jgi:hypothetical protein
MVGYWLAARTTKYNVFYLLSFFDVPNLFVHQTCRIWDAQTGECKSELRGHEHIIEVAVFAPIYAYAAIRELAGVTVRICVDHSTRSHT